ncbi:LysM domain-containing protein [Trichoderma lentiforme]|uniref:LysM domain-containing protein n=1 Tax=Trichoderma lentiforme TaxID=1567552 RepID=A0A9P4XDH5_9HYPO|nr:LysM domain-containing protein [Trichoderma lentiforme]
MRESQLLAFAAAAVIPHLVQADIVPYPVPLPPNGFGSKTTISASCQAALNKTITGCDASLANLAASGIYLSPNALGSASTFGITTGCGQSPVIDSSLANTFLGDLFQDYYTLICSKDAASGDFCADFLLDQYAKQPNATDITDYPKSVLCSSCQLSYYQILQRSPFLGYNAKLALQWQSIQDICGLNLLAGSSASNATFPDAVNVNTTAASIALSQSVSQGALWVPNNLLPACSLLKPGQSLCLPKSCATYTAQASDSYQSIADNNNITVNNVLAYNPTINPPCTNLNTTGGPVICISSPDGVYVPPSQISNSSSSNVHGEYADSVVPAQGSTPFGTTDQCGDYYQVQVADTCSHISLANSVSIDLFKLINPAIDKDCFNLITGLWYCVHPILGWNATDISSGDSTTVAPPAPTPTGTTDQCFAWHVVVSGDSCFSLQSTLGATMAQLLAWNPNLKDDCSNLLLGVAYCVRGPATSSNTTTTTAKTTTTTTAKASSTSSTARSSSTATDSGCSQTYTVVSGDFCFAIWTKFNLTEAQFRALNPSLDTACTITIGQTLCVA